MIRTKYKGRAKLCALCETTVGVKDVETRDFYICKFCEYKINNKKYPSFYNLNMKIRKERDVVREKDVKKNNS